jgi:nucleotidyltransferase/DNA polymerase involved in DNA repair
MGVVKVDGEVSIVINIDRHVLGSIGVRDVPGSTGDFVTALRKFLLELLDKRVRALLVHSLEGRARVIRHSIGNYRDRRKNRQQDDEQQFGAEAHGLASILNEMHREMAQKRVEDSFLVANTLFE